MPRFAKRVVASLTLPVAALALALGAPARAQQPAPPSAGGTPEKIPFDIPYGEPLTLETAQKLVAQVVGEGTRRGWKFNVAVVDPNGDLVAFARMNGAMLASVTVSQRKARTAARFRRETRVFFNAMETGHPYVTSLDPEVTASPGGFPLVVGGKLVGAIGCSGGTGDQDATVCKTAVDLLK